ncbi:MAG: sugar transferase, partial [Erysipelotrichia bacterium]|nr:sugar transferase [Erysipelotrichia bacterium]
MVYLKIKRLIDIILSTLGLIILSPVFLVLIIAIKLDSPG